MAMGQQKDRQGDLMVSWSEMPRSPGHVFYDRLQLVLIEGGFDGFAEAVCQPYYAARMGAPSVPPGRYFRMHLVGSAIDMSKRGIRLLGVYNVGVRHLMTKNPVESIDDLQGLKIRTMQSKYHMAAFNAFGANATPISYAELYSSLQTGVVDGAEAANTNYFEKKFFEVAPYWGQLGWTILTAPIIMSEEKFASLPADAQKALLEGGAKAAAWEQDYYAAVDK